MLAVSEYTMLSDFAWIRYGGFAMTYLNAQERDRLLDELKAMSFKRAKGKLARLDPKGRLVYYRNVQAVGEWHTKFILNGLGAIVTLVEHSHTENTQARNKQRFEFVSVIVEPAPFNPS